MFQKGINLPEHASTGQFWHTYSLDVVERLLNSKTTRSLHGRKLMHWYYLGQQVARNPFGKVVDSGPFC